MIAKLPVVVLSILCFLQTPSYLQRPPDTRAQPSQDCEQKLRSLRSDFEGTKRACDAERKACACGKAYKDLAQASESKLETCETRAQAHESTIRSLRDENIKLKDLNAGILIEKDKFKALYEGAISERDKLKDRNTVLQGTVDEFSRRLGSESSKYADLLEQAKKSKIEYSEIVPTAEQPAEKPGTISAAAVETYKTLLTTDDIANKASNDKSVEYKTVTEDGKTYQLRELMIGTLLFPDPSTLEVEPEKPLNIEVKFRPNALLKNSSVDGKTNWFLDFNFAPDRIQDFVYDEVGSKGKLKRLVGDEGEETWIWKIGRMPDNFSADTPRIQIDGSAEIDGLEIVKKKIENNPLLIKEKPIPNFLAVIFRSFIEYSTIILIFSTAAFGVGTAYFGLRKARIENKMKETEARNSELERQITEAETPGGSAESS